MSVEPESADAWFTYYKGQGRRTFQPRNGKGWRAIFAFVGYATLLAAMTVMLTFIDPRLVPVGPVLLLIGGFVFFRICLTHSVVIDINEVSRNWSEYQAWKQDRRQP